MFQLSRLVVIKIPNMKELFKSNGSTYEDEFLKTFKLNSEIQIL